MSRHSENDYPTIKDREWMRTVLKYLEIGDTVKFHEGMYDRNKELVDTYVCTDTTSVWRDNLDYAKTKKRHKLIVAYNFENETDRRHLDVVTLWSCGQFDIIKKGSVQ